MRQVPSYAALDGLPLSYGVASLLGAVAALCLCFAAMHIRRRRSGLTMRKKDVASQQASTSSSPRGLIKSGEHTAEGSTEPVSVNYHFLRSCNYSCGFCFHTATTSHIEPLNRAAHALQLLREAGCEKLNFSGGEPFLADSGKHVGELCRIAKQDFKYRSVSIVSNGSLITEEWFRQYAAYLDILAISCDSFDDKRNRQIGRVDRKSNHLPHADKLRLISQWCAAYDVRFKINTVVNKFNVDEDFTVPMQQLKPCRWKVFQCLEVDGENAGESAKRRAKEFLIPDEAFRSFVDAHRDSLRASGVPVVPEDNASMRASYIIMDEYLRFLDCSTGGKIPSKCILDVGVDEAMKQSGFDRRMFFHRGGYYPWHKSDNNSLVW